MNLEYIIQSSQPLSEVGIAMIPFFWVNVETVNEAHRCEVTSQSNTLLSGEAKVTLGVLAPASMVFTPCCTSFVTTFMLAFLQQVLIECWPDRVPHSLQRLGYTSKQNRHTNWVAAVCLAPWRQPPPPPPRTSWWPDKSGPCPALIGEADVHQLSFKEVQVPYRTEGRENLPPEVISSLSWDRNGKGNSWKGKQNLLPEYNGLKDGWLACTEPREQGDRQEDTVSVSFCDLGTKTI